MIFRPFTRLTAVCLVFIFQNPFVDPRTWIGRHNETKMLRWMWLNCMELTIFFLLFIYDYLMKVRLTNCVFFLRPFLSLTVFSRILHAFKSLFKSLKNSISDFALFLFHLSSCLARYYFFSWYVKTISIMDRISNDCMITEREFNSNVHTRENEGEENVVTTLGYRPEYGKSSIYDV